MARDLESLFRGGRKKRTLITREKRVSQMMGFLSENMIPQSDKLLESYRDKPVEFIQDILGSNPWEKQREIANALVKHSRVSVQSCHNSGKTWIAARITLWFLCTRPGSIVVTTAPTMHQVRNLLWREIRMAHGGARTRLPGDCHQTELNLAPRWYAIGLSTNEPVRFQGYHSSEGLLFIVDEAAGVPEEIFEASSGFMTQEEARTLLIGNPNTASGFFWKANTSSTWKRFHINAHDVPKDLLREGWIYECQEDWGPDYETDPRYLVRVMGQYPPTGQDWQLITQSMLTSAEEIPLDIEGNELTECHLGVDVAREGKDVNVTTFTRGNIVEDVKSWRSPDLMFTADRVAELIEGYGLPPENCHVDVIGIGAGVVDRLRQRGISVEGVHYGGRPAGDWRALCGDTTFDNRKAELHWVGRQLLLQNKACVPKGFSNTWKDLQRINYEYTKRGTLAIENKAQLRKRYKGESPDFADSWFLALSRVGAGPYVWFA